MTEILFYLLEGKALFRDDEGSTKGKSKTPTVLRTAGTWCTWRGVEQPGCWGLLGIELGRAPPGLSEPGNPETCTLGACSTGYKASSQRGSGPCTGALVRALPLHWPSSALFIHAPCWGAAYSTADAALHTGSIAMNKPKPSHYCLDWLSYGEEM